MAEHVTRAEGESGRAGPGDQLHGDDAVAAEREEVVLDTYAFETEHVRDESAEGLLQRGARAGVSDLGGEVRGGQGTAVELAVGGEREGVEGDDGGRDHVVGQRLGGVGAELGRVHGASRHDVRDEPIVPEDDRGVRDALVRGQHALDLAEFDAEAAQLDLVVGAAEVLQFTVPGPAGQVAGAVHAGAGLDGVRVGDEAFGGQGGSAEVAARQLHARQMEFA